MDPVKKYYITGDLLNTTEDFCTEEIPVFRFASTGMTAIKTDDRNGAFFVFRRVRHHGRNDSHKEK